MQKYKLCILVIKSVVSALNSDMQKFTYSQQEQTVSIHVKSHQKAKPKTNKKQTNTARQTLERQKISELLWSMIVNIKLRKVLDLLSFQFAANGYQCISYCTLSMIHYFKTDYNAVLTNVLNMKRKKRLVVLFQY